MIWKTSLATSLLLLFLLPVQASGAELAGRVVRIVGDTLVLVDATKTQHKVRLAGTAQSADNPGAHEPSKPCRTMSSTAG
jgi:endonuclease YncB( thermonuclease family)